MKKSFVENVVWLQIALIISLISALIIRYGYFFHSDVLGRRGLAFFMAVFVVIESFRIVFSWEPGNILVNEISRDRDNLEYRNNLAFQGLCFSLSFTVPGAALILLIADPLTSYYMRNWLTHDINRDIVLPILIQAVKLTALIPVLHSIQQWITDLLHALEKMKASGPNIVASNLAIPLGALGGYIYSKQHLGDVFVVEHFPTMVKGVLLFYVTAILINLVILKYHYPGLLKKICTSNWQMPNKSMRRQIFNLSISKKIGELYARFPLWLSLFYLAPDHFVLLHLSLKLFEACIMPFGPISKALLPKLAPAFTKKHYKHVRSQIKRVDITSVGIILFMAITVTLGAFYILFPIMKDLQEWEIQLIKDQAYPLLFAFIFLGINTTNSVQIVTYNMTDFFLKLSLIQLPICAFVAYYFTKEYYFLGACIYVVFYHGFTSIMNKYFLMSKLNSLIKDS